MILRRPPDGFRDASTFLNLAGNGAAPENRGGLGVKTTWFALGRAVSSCPQTTRSASRAPRTCRC
jgi:general secretion pathway protein K